MKEITAVLLVLLLLTGCAGKSAAEERTPPSLDMPPMETEALVPIVDAPAPEYVSRFDTVTEISLSDEGITVNGGEESEAVFTSHDILYYEDRSTHPSGRPYGEGKESDRHTAAEAKAHTVVNITRPGAYRVSGTLTAGQIRIDLGGEAPSDPEAVVELILDGADITCTVAPAIVFENIYECSSGWNIRTASAEPDTSAAGASLILAEGSENTVSGSHVAKIYNDSADGGKLLQQAGAIYSAASLNIYGPGALTVSGDKTGITSALHLSINGGDITVRSGADGITADEDGISVISVNGGTLDITAGLSDDGDGIDSRGYLTISGGTMVICAADSGLEADVQSRILGGTVSALGNSSGWAEATEGQVVLNLQFAREQSGGTIVVGNATGIPIFACAIPEGPSYTGAILSCPYFAQGAGYSLYTGGSLDGTETHGIYDIFNASYSGGTRMQYTDSDTELIPDTIFVSPMGGRDFGGERPEGMERPNNSSGMSGLMGPEEDRSTIFYTQDLTNRFYGLTAAE